MAVPKKRTSKSKKNSRLANWSKKANIQAKRALSLAKSILSGETTSFISNLEQNNTDTVK
jgi:large subunit ribosomal protein L32